MAGLARHFKLTVAGAMRIPGETKRAQNWQWVFNSEEDFLQRKRTGEDAEQTKNPLSAPFWLCYEFFFPTAFHQPPTIFPH